MYRAPAAPLGRAPPSSCSAIRRARESSSDIEFSDIEFSDIEFSDIEFSDIDFSATSDLLLRGAGPL